MRTQDDRHFTGRGGTVRPGAAREGAGLPEGALGLGAGLDLGEIAGLIMEATVPRFADAAGIYVLEHLLTAGEPDGGAGGGRVVARRLAVGLSEGGRQVPSGAFPAGEVVAFDGGSPYARCVTSGEPVLSGQLDGETLHQAASRPGGRAIVSQFSSFLAVPMLAGEEVAGLIMFARTTASPAFGHRDADAMAALASRAGACVAGALLLIRQRSAMDALHRVLAPRNPPVPPGIDVAGRCLPAAGHAFSGDWYDVISLPGSRTGLVVGDVMGHGPEAAALMAQLRAAAHALAGLDLAPAELLRQLDRTAAAFASGSYATCTYAVLDAHEGSCLIARAGHLPPVVALPPPLSPPAGATRVPDLPSGLPLGLGVAIYDERRIAVPPGAILGLFTDGLVEGRRRTSDEGILALRSALARSAASTSTRHPGWLPTTCDALIASLAGQREDDTTLVLARIPPRGRAHPSAAGTL